MREKGIQFLSVDLACLSGSRAAVISEMPTEGRKAIRVLAFLLSRLFSGMPMGYQVDPDNSCNQPGNSKNQLDD